MKAETYFKGALQLLKYDESFLFFIWGLMANQR